MAGLLTGGHSVNDALCNFNTANNYYVGALLYEMLVGLPPFYSRNRETMFEKIMRADLHFPNYVSEVLRVFRLIF